MFGKNELPPPGTKITSSSLVEHPKLYKSVYTENGFFEFICHTKDGDEKPFVLFEFPYKFSDKNIVIYNRLDNTRTGQEVAKKIKGTIFSISEDAITWYDLDTDLRYENIFNGKPIVLNCGRPFRFLKLYKNKSSEAIHISQLYLSAIGNRTTSFNAGQTKKFADYYSLELSASGYIYESFVYKEKGPVLAVCSTLDKSPKNVNVIAVKNLGRFGNALIQVGNAIDLAKALNLNRVYLMDKGAVEKIFLKEKAFCIDKINVKVVDSIEPTDVCLQGKFFYRDVTKVIAKDNVAVGKTIEKLLPNLSISKDDSPSSEGVLTIHIRSGDVFSICEKVHPGYGQPPLAYYKKVISDFKPCSVVIVFEDKNNPVIDALISYCMHCKLGVAEVSGSLAEDLGVLLRANTVVAGNGTFMCVVAALSRNLKKIYSFERPIDAMGKPNISNVVIRDREGEYKAKILSSNWNNSLDQRELMLTYPTDCLEFK